VIIGTLFFSCKGENQMKIKVIVEKGTDGYFAVHCPSLKSCWSQGKTKEEALKNIREAIELFLESEIKDFGEDENHEICELVL
jgi:predicted RNase H-like HicB family nuclease